MIEATHISAGFLGFTASSFMFFVKPRLKDVWKSQGPTTKYGFKQTVCWEEQLQHALLFILSEEPEGIQVQNRDALITHMESQRWWQIRNKYRRLVGADGASHAYCHSSKSVCLNIQHQRKSSMGYLRSPLSSPSSWTTAKSGSMLLQWFPNE